MEEQYEQFHETNTQPLQRDKYAKASLIAGIVSILGSLYILPGVIIGIAAITLGILSRVNYEKFNIQNILGITFGGIAIVLSGFMFLGTIMLLREPEVLQEFMEIYETHFAK